MGQPTQNHESIQLKKNRKLKKKTNKQTNKTKAVRMTETRVFQHCLLIHCFFNIYYKDPNFDLSLLHWPLTYKVAYEMQNVFGWW